MLTPNRRGPFPSLRLSVFARHLSGELDVRRSFESILLPAPAGTRITSLSDRPSRLILRQRISVREKRKGGVGVWPEGPQRLRFRKHFYRR